MLVATATGVMVAVASSGATPNEVRLHLGSDGQFFKYGTTTQTLTTASNNCKINSAEPLIDLGTPTGSTAPGIGPDNSIGVRSNQGGNGTPCSQIDQTESLSLKPGTTIAGRSFSGLRLDLEMTGNARVNLTLSNSTTSALYQLQTGTSIAPAQAAEPDYDTTVPYTVSSSPGDTTDGCAAPNSSGPNSGANDNCEWTVQPGFNFTSVTLTTTVGTVSLEGSGDFGNNPEFDTVFYLSNTPPTATDDTVTTAEDTAKSGNVLTNDSDADGNPLSATLVTGPNHGTVSLAATGAFTYTPAADYNGPDSFTYAASDGIASSNATVHITVTPVNDPPVAQSGSASTNEDQTVTITIATDIDSTSLTASCTGAAGGTVHDNGDGTIDFTPAANFNGTVTLTCTATDDQGAQTTSSATIVVGVTPVNDAPVAHDDTAEVAQNGSVDIPVLANDTDVDGDTLTPTSIGSLSPSGSAAVANPDGTVTFTPPAGYTGAASFTYKASDGQATSNTANVDLTVYPVICSNETVTDTDAGVTGSFTRLDDSFNCKRYALDASAASGTVLFKPNGAAAVDYRGFVSFDSTAAPIGPFPLLLEYDPAGGTTFQPVQWCVNPSFDGSGLVTAATLPAGQTWCIASADTRGNSSGALVTTWQVFGHDDPRFR
ncbi:MAG: tandem-95 repeat protein [Acidimicrobiia bacterium]|nr:tandem-95 repeat protein [Acidimicrobiia bacterium]